MPYSMCRQHRSLALRRPSTLRLHQDKMPSRKLAADGAGRRRQLWGSGPQLLGALALH